MTKYKFDCGCEVDIIDEEIKSYDQLPKLKIDYEEMLIDINYGKVCPFVWDLFEQGKTKGVFQLETNLGQSWAQRVRPHSIGEIAALISLIRPGILKAELDGKSLAKHYVDRKLGEDEVVYFHPALEEFLDNTYGVILFQEQILAIVKKLAGLSDSEADILRKGMGKKKPELVEQVKSLFIEGCKKQGILTEEEAKEIFSWIEKSNRYSFNVSHGVCYGTISYLTAWVKTHFPLHFYCSWIKHARNKQKSQQETKELVKDARSFGIEVNTPSIDNLWNNSSDVTINIDQLSFGLKSIKNMGEKAVIDFLAKVQAGEKKAGCLITDMSWTDFILYIAKLIKKTSMICLISVGLFDYFGLSRQRMLYEYDLCRDLTVKDLEKMHDLHHLSDNLVELLQLFVKQEGKAGPANKNRREKIEGIIFSLLNPSFELDHDDPKWILRQETDLLGVPLTYSSIDTVNKEVVSNTSCDQFHQGIDKKNMIISGEIISSRPYLCKNNKEMGFASLEDNTGIIDCVIFSDVWEEFSYLFFEGSLVTCVGYRSKENSFCVTKVFEI